jgi:YggT family protein
MIDSLIIAFSTILINIISLYKWVIIIGAILSWVNPDPYNPIVQMIYRITEPAYALVRRYIPTVFSGVDLSALVLIFIVQFIEIFLTNLLFR